MPCHKHHVSPAWTTRLALLASPALALLLIISKMFASAYQPSQNPPWPPTYDMLGSLISMQKNSSGFSSPDRGSEFGIISYDWSNAKSLWALDRPMSCEEALVEQVERTKAATTDDDAALAGGGRRIFVYRNIVKALPWFSAVRSKLDDPAYSGFFLRFDPDETRYHVPRCARENRAHCSEYYHDQEQTPEVPIPSDEHPDGSCAGYCDCGEHPCGEYLFDHRNGTMLREWIIDELVLGPTAVGHPFVEGLFLDDFWCSNLICEATQNRTSGCPCKDPVQGPTEIDKYAQLDMNLSDQDIKDITVEWNRTMKDVEQALLDHKAYSWSLMAGQENANASPLLLRSNATECTQALRGACTPDSVWQQKTVLFGFSVNGTVLTQLHQDLAFFLLARGPYAYAGWGQWGMIWPFNKEPAHGQLPSSPHGVPLPKELYYDFGVPEEQVCIETEPGVFRRKWSKVEVALDYTDFAANMIYHTGQHQQEELSDKLL